MAHGDKLPGNFYGASYSSLSRQLQLHSRILSLHIAASLWPSSYSVLLSSVQNTLLIVPAWPKALIPSALSDSHHWLHSFYHLLSFKFLMLPLQSQAEVSPAPAPLLFLPLFSVWEIKN